MNQSTRKALCSKWMIILREYELVKKDISINFMNIRQLCNAYKVTRRDIRKYHTRWIESGMQEESLLPQKRGPKPGTLKLLSKAEERFIVSIQRKLNANIYEIHTLVEGQFEVPPSVSTIYRTLKRYPLNPKRKALIKRYEKSYPGELLHCDAFALDRTLFEDRKKRYLIGAVDDLTRLCYVQLTDNIKAVSACKVFFNAYKWFGLHGVHADAVMTDNGVEFTTYTGGKNAKKTHNFEMMLQILKVKHQYTRPYRPQTNGKIERFWRTIKNECLRLQLRAISPAEFESELNGFMIRYNYHRKHSALQYTTPLDKLAQIAALFETKEAQLNNVT